MTNHLILRACVALALVIPVFFSAGRLHAVPSFWNPAFFGTAASPRVVAISDLDGDADLDLAVISTNGELTLCFNNGAGAFPAVVVHPDLWSADAIDIAAGDLDADGDADLAVALLEINGTIAILANRGNGTFDPPVFLRASSFAKGVTIAALNADALADIAMMSNSFKATVFLNDGSDSFTLGGHYGDGYVSSVIRAADLDGDGDRDIVYVNSGISNVTVLKNSGDGAFGPHTWYDTGSYPNDVVLVDVDGDNDVDIASPNVYDGDVAVLRNQGNGAFLAAEHFPGVADPTGIAAGDLDLDGDVDLVVANRAGDDIAILASTGSGFGTPERRSVGDAPTDVAVADLNGDGRVDLITVNSNGGDVAVLLNTTSTVDVGERIAGKEGISLAAAFPNPSRRGTSTVITLPTTAGVRLDVHDVHGRIQEVLIEGPLTAGKHPIRWEGLDSRQSHAPAGLYFLRLSVNGAIVGRQRMVLLP